MAYVISPERREKYRETSIRSQKRKIALLGASNNGPLPAVGPRLNVNALMPIRQESDILALSLFSGGGGLDLGAERAGLAHVASFDILDICGSTLRFNRPHWPIFDGEMGNVEETDWAQFRGIDVIHGGPPCQPFSTAGHRGGSSDPRNMWPAFVRSVLTCRPALFVAENVPGLLDEKFRHFVEWNIFRPLAPHYVISHFRLDASHFGVPQARKRVFFVGFRSKRFASRFKLPAPTHGQVSLLNPDSRPLNLARQSLGLPDIGFDSFAPTLRSGFTGPRNTTGVVNSKASLALWDRLQIWPNGVQPNRSLAHSYPPENGHYRLSVQDCALLQGFPDDWAFQGAVYQALGQIGNSVCPPVAYAVACSAVEALR